VTSLLPPPVSLFLTRLGVPHRVFQHPGPVTSLEQAARERGQSPQQVVRSLVFRLAEGRFFMALIAGPEQVSWAALRRYFSQSRLTMATAEEALAVTGYRVGSISPLGLPAPLPIVADPGVFTPQEISLGSGQPGLAVILASADLRRLLPQAEILPLAAPAAEKTN